MTKLFFSPGACCMSCHITLEMTHTPFELVYVGKNADEKTRAEFLKVNSLGAVPAVLFDDGKILTQNIAILEYIADQKPEAKLIAPAGTWERAEIMKWLSFIASDLHKAFAPIFYLSKISSDENAQRDIKKWAFANIEKYLTLLEKHLSDKTYLVGEHFTIADAYLFTVYQWSKPVGFPTEPFTALNNYSERIAALPAVKKVHEREEAFR